MTTFTKTTSVTISCPRCGGDHIRRNGQQSGYQRFRCADCDKQFRHGMQTGKRVPAEQVGAGFPQQP